MYIIYILISCQGDISNFHLSLGFNIKYAHFGLKKKNFNYKLACSFI